jgi:pectinesterase
MHAGRDEYIKILASHGKLHEVVTFDAPHSFVFFNPWFDKIIEHIDSFILKL